MPGCSNGIRLGSHLLYLSLYGDCVVCFKDNNWNFLQLLLLLPPRRVLCTQISHCIFDFFLETHITLPNLWAPQMKVRSNGASAEQTSVLDSFATVGSMYLADICSHARLMSPGNENKLIIFSR